MACIDELPDPDGLFVVRAVPWSGGHELHVEGVGATQTDPEHQSALDQVRSMLALMYERAPETFAIRIEYELQDGPSLDIGDD